MTGERMTIGQSSRGKILRFYSSQADPRDPREREIIFTRLPPISSSVRFVLILRAASPREFRERVIFSKANIRGLFSTFYFLRAAVSTRLRLA